MRQDLQTANRRATLRQKCPPAFLPRPARWFAECTHGPGIRSAAWNALPLLCALAAGGALWGWLWGRWFSPGGEFLHGCIHLALVAGCLSRVLRAERRDTEPDRAPLALAGLFLAAAAFLYGRIPTLLIAALYSSAVYWSFRASPACAKGKSAFALWLLLILSLPIAPSLQFVFGYPLRALAARAATLILPGAVKAVGSGLGDGTVEVFVDAPCAGAGMLTSALFLAAGAALVFSFEWLRCGVMLAAGMACALSANAARAAILYLGNAGLISFPLHEYERLTGLFCFTACAALLTLLALLLSKWKAAAPSEHDAPPKRAGGKPFAATAAHCLLCATLFIAVLSTPVRWNAPTVLPGEVHWPETWNGRPIAQAEQSPETAGFWSAFPGVCREFTAVAPGHSAAAPERIVMRLVTRPTRLLHPAEDCFRGSGYSVTPLPARTDRHDRLWSGFTGEKNGRKHTVRQCIIATGSLDLRNVEENAEAKSWPDVSSWYWDAARPGTSVPATALAVTVISASE